MILPIFLLCVFSKDYAYDITKPVFLDLSVGQGDTITIKGNRILVTFFPKIPKHGSYVIDGSKNYNMDEASGYYFGDHNVELTVRLDQKDIIQFAAVSLDFFGSVTDDFYVKFLAESYNLQQDTFIFSSTPVVCKTNSSYIDSDGSIKVGENGCSRFFFLRKYSNPKFYLTSIDFRNYLPVKKLHSKLGVQMIELPSETKSEIYFYDFNPCEDIFVSQYIIRKGETLKITGSRNIAIYSETKDAIAFNGKVSQLFGNEADEDINLSLANGFDYSYFTVAGIQKSSREVMNTLVLSGKNNIVIRNFSIVIFPSTNKFNISTSYKSCSLYPGKAPVVALLSPSDTVSIQTYDALSPLVTAYVRPEGKTDFCNNTNGDVPIPLGRGVHSVEKNSHYEIRSRLIAVEGNCIVKTDQGTFTNPNPSVYCSTGKISINTENNNAVVAVFNVSKNIKRCILIYGNDFNYQIDPEETGREKDVAIYPFSVGSKSEIKISAQNLVVNGEIAGTPQTIASGSTIEISTFAPPLSGQIEVHSSNGKQWYRKAVLLINESSTTSFDYFEPPQPTEAPSSFSSSEEERSSFSS